MHPFCFTRRVVFLCPDPDSSFVFDPLQNNWFHWYGKELDKIGIYFFVEGEQLSIDLEWNYGREQTNTVLSTLGTGDKMKGFVLKDNKHGTRYSFSR